MHDHAAIVQYSFFTYNAHFSVEISKIVRKTQFCVLRLICEGVFRERVSFARQ